MPTGTTRIFTAQEIGARILAKVLSHLGEREATGKNDGPYAKRYLAYVGITWADSWCAAFASACTGWMLDQMGLQSMVRLKTASSHMAVDWALQHHTLQTAQTAVPGDWVILKGGSGDPAQNGVSYHHTAVLEWIEGELCAWVGGNTSNAVARGKSHLSDVTLLRPYILPTQKAA